MKKIFLPACALLGAVLCAEEYKVDFTAAKPWGEVKIYANRLAVKNQELKGRKATVISNVAEKKGETDNAFGLMTKVFPVAGKKTIELSAQVLASKGFDGCSGGNIYSPRIRFFDAGNKELKEFAAIKLPQSSGEFQELKGTYAVPAQAARAQIVFGCDKPNLLKGQTFAVADVKYSTK